MSLTHVESWIFDLDNSLYPASCDLLGLMGIRMRQFIQRLVGCDEQEAFQIQKRHFHQHGTTLAGLMREHGIDPREFLDFVHDIDLAQLIADPRVVAALDGLPGRKFIFTNADEGHARRVLDRLGLANAFDGMHDIHAMNYVPKPDPDAYSAMCDALGVDPARALFVDDMVRNLAPAKALGMVTVWVDNGSEQAGELGDDLALDAVVDYRTSDIGDWLTQVAAREVA